MIELRSLVARLHPLCRGALERAAERCVRQTHFDIELEHLLAELVEIPESDLARALRAFGIEPSRIRDELARTGEGLRRGNSRTPALSRRVVEALSAAWSLTSLELGVAVVRSGAILAAALEDDSLRGLLVAAAPSLAAVPRVRLREELPAIMRGSAEDDGTVDRAAEARSSRALDAYTVDLTAEAAAGRIDPISGRESEIRQLVDVLLRRRQNNPILVGDAGVGKTAIVEGLALRLVSGDVPPALRGVALRTLDLGLLQAGAGVKGEFEHRLCCVIDEVAGSTRPVILFIDEAHTLIGAGGPAGQGDAANLLKPALARGTLRTIAATTWAEYKRHIEKDPALERRFQPIKVAEPAAAAAVTMLRGVAVRLQAHHGVPILDEAVVEAVRLSQRYLTGRQLPDKAVSVLDTAAARVAMAQSHTPPTLEDLAVRGAELDQELATLEAEGILGLAHGERIEPLRDERERVRESHDRLRSAWQQECHTVAAIRAAERRLGSAGEAEGARLRDELGGLRLELEVLQEGTRLVPPMVDGRAIAEVVSGWTGIPTGRMLAEGAVGARGLREAMARRVIGQDQALDTICRRIQTYFAQLGEPGKPTGVFLLVGPSGVGKTETALALAELLFGGPQALVTVNMSEYQEAHSVSLLKGAPPGYVGHGKGGVLTEAVRRRPYCVVLLDEIEKAHADVLELFYQVMDKGLLEDSDGQAVDFTNTVMILTSNVGAELLERVRSVTVDADALRSRLRRHFPAAFLGRVVVVPYLALGEAELDAVVELKLARVQERFETTHHAALSWDRQLVQAIRARATESESGARAVDAILTHGLLPGLAGQVLDRIAGGEAIGDVHVGVDPRGDPSFEFRP